MFTKRVENIKQKLHNEKFDAVLISSVSDISYLTGFTNFSKEEREAYLLIGKDFQYIITDGRYSEAVKKQVPHFTLFERNQQNKIEDLFIKIQRKIKNLGIEEDNLTVAEYKLVKKHFKKTKHFDSSGFRKIKTEDEIKKIEKACFIGDLAFEFILKEIKSGITEKQVALKLENFIKQKGAEFSFPAIVAFGKNSSIPHHQTGETIFGLSTHSSTKEYRSGRGEFILLDFGVKVDNYCSDMTRTVFLGKPSEEQKTIYKIVLDAQRKAVNFINTAIKSGYKVLASKVDKAARDYILSQGFPTIPHSLGHGIGIDVHERPSLSTSSKDELSKGIVFSIEPGIYLPGFGGIRIEDLFVFEKDQLRQLTTSSKNRIEL